MHAIDKAPEEVMEFITEFVRDDSYSPSYEELANWDELASAATVHTSTSLLYRAGHCRCRFEAQNGPPKSPTPLHLPGTAPWNPFRRSPLENPR